MELFDTEKHTITYCNAGHNVPVFIQQGKNIRLDKGGMILSWKENYEYDEEEVLFEKGSTLVVFSDGITEAMNEAEEQYGDERLFVSNRKRIYIRFQTISNRNFERCKKIHRGSSSSG